MLKADFSLNNQGSIVLLEPLSESAKEWVAEHIGADNGYQPYYPTVLVEPRYVEAILEGIKEEGLSYATI